VSGADELVRLWEAGSACPSVERPLRLLAAAGEGEAGQLAQVGLGLRDRRLLALRDRLFGPGMDCTADCPACGAVNAFGLDTRALEALGDAASGDDRIRFDWNGAPVELRRLSTADLIAVAGLDPADMRSGLVARAVAAAGLPLDDALVEEAARRLEAADPLAAVSLELCCAECGAAFSVGVDPAECLWVEIAAAARRLLSEVHRLAAAYSWSETAILSLSAARRRAYLDMVGA
jgi:hypothetical protein